MNRNTRNITIGLIDGLTVPFALAAGLSSIIASSRVVFASSLAVTIACAITMTAGAYMSAQKHEPDRMWSSALTIGFSYIAGGLAGIFPFLIIDTPLHALRYSAMITLTVLFIAGYVDSRLNHANAWLGAVRVALTGAVAGAAALGVAALFK